MKGFKKIKGFNNYLINKEGKIFNISLNRFVNNCVGSRGYIQVCLKSNGKYFTKNLHRLLAKAFLPNPKNLPHINHKNGVKSDFSLNNLEWCTPSHNLKHAFDNKLKIPVKGEECYNSKLNNKTVKYIRKFKKHPYSKRRELAEELNVGISTIDDVILNRTWVHVK